MNKKLTIIGLILVIMIQIVAASRPAEIPMLAYGRVQDKNGNDALAQVLIKSYNPFTGSLNVETGAMTGTLKEGYFFIKFENKGNENVVAEAGTTDQEGKTLHKITDEDDYKSYFKFNTINMKDKTEEAYCGDNNLDLGEECDDGNTIDGDGCSSTCEIESIPTPQCGDGNLDVMMGEECDDGNKISGDGCSSFCTIEDLGIKIELHAGWNNMILPKTPTDNSIEEVLAEVDYQIIWKDIGNTHIVYSPKLQMGEFNTLEQGTSYWILVNQPTILTIY